jgi:hypothetical protein
LQGRRSHHLRHSTSPVFCRFFQDRVSQTICLMLASNCNLPALCLLSSWEYSHEPLAPGFWKLLSSSRMDKRTLTTESQTWCDF